MPQTAPDIPATIVPDAATLVERMRRVNPEADPLAVMPDVHPSLIPRHIAIIMDGNGRWARQRGAPRAIGHHAGAKAVRRTMAACSRLGVEALTLYSFSSENWKRPPEEVHALMSLYAESLRSERDELQSRNIRFRQIGRREGLPAEVLAEVDATVEATRACTGPTLCVAVNYGGRAEIVDAVRRIARRVAAGDLAPDEINEGALDACLYTAGIPDPDLVIRTAGEMRVSNFLLWQISYAELHVSNVYWPDFDAEHLYSAVRDYARRTRRFGGLADAGG